MPKGTKKPTAVERSSYVDMNYLIETIYHNDAPHYAVMNGTSGHIQIVTTANPKPTLTIKPYGDPKRNIEDRAVLLPNKPMPYKSKLELLSTIQQYIHDYADMPPFWEKFSAHYALMTWVFDLFGAVGYLRFFGEPESGKTRMANCVAECSYRTILVSGGTTVSPMFRMIEMYKGTLSIDEADFRESDLDSDIIKLLNAGYRRGGHVLRSDKEGDGYYPKAYDVYSPKILTSRRRFKDEATESRCFTYIVPKGKPVRPGVPVQLLPDPLNPNSFESRGQRIRNMCLQWRFDNYRSLVPDMNVPANMSNRYREICVPILTLVDDQKFKDEIIAFLSDEDESSRQESEAALCVQGLRQCAGGLAKGTVMPGEVAVAMMEIAKDNGEEFKTTGRAVGDRLHQLGLKRAPRTGKGRPYYFTRTEIDDLVKHYCL